METMEEKVSFEQKIRSQRKGLVDVSKEEDEFKVHSGYAKFVAEKESSMEKEKEASPFSEIPLLHFRLEPRHHFTSQDPRIQLLFWPGV